MDIIFFPSCHPFSCKINFDKKKQRTLHHDPEPSGQTVGFERLIFQSQNNIHLLGFTFRQSRLVFVSEQHFFLYSSESRIQIEIYVYVWVCVFSKGVPQRSPCGGTLNAPINYLTLHQIVYCSCIVCTCIHWIFLSAYYFSQAPEVACSLPFCARF
jgi:hypothetical protein